MRKKHGKTYIYIYKTSQSKEPIYFRVEENNCDIRRFDSDVIDDSDFLGILSTVPGLHIPDAL